MNHTDIHITPQNVFLCLPFNQWYTNMSTQPLLRSLIYTRISLTSILYVSPKTKRPFFIYELWIQIFIENPYLKTFQLISCNLSLLFTVFLLCIRFEWFHCFRTYLSRHKATRALKRIALNQCSSNSSNDSLVFGANMESGQQSMDTVVEPGRNYTTENNLLCYNYHSMFFNWCSLTAIIKKPTEMSIFWLE